MTAARQWVLGHVENLLHSMKADPALSQDNKQAAQEILSELNSLVFMPSVEGSVDTAQLAKFYGVSSLYQLVSAQCRHIERLQSKMPKTPPLFPGRVREG